MSFWAWLIDVLIYTVTTFLRPNLAPVWNWHTAQDKWGPIFTILKINSYQLQIKWKNVSSERVVCHFCSEFLTQLLLNNIQSLLSCFRQKSALRISSTTFCGLLKITNSCFPLKNSPYKLTIQKNNNSLSLNWLKEIIHLDLCKYGNFSKNLKKYFVPCRGGLSIQHRGIFQYSWSSSSACEESQGQSPEGSR